MQLGAMITDGNFTATEASGKVYGANGSTAFSDTISNTAKGGIYSFTFSPNYSDSTATWVLSVPDGS